MIQGSKNAAGWWSSFVCSLRIDPFRDVPGILVTKPIFMGGTPPPWLAALIMMRLRAKKQFTLGTHRESQSKVEKLVPFRIVYVLCPP